MCCGVFVYCCIATSAYVNDMNHTVYVNTNHYLKKKRKMYISMRASIFRPSNGLLLFMIRELVSHTLLFVYLLNSDKDTNVSWVFCSHV